MKPNKSANDRAVAGTFGASNPARKNCDPTLSCVLPCRNEASALKLLLPRLIDAVSSCVQHWEIIVVDDASTDATSLVLDNWSRVLGVRAVQLSRNFGKAAALMAGLQLAVGEVVVVIVADLLHEPELITPLVEKWREGANVVRACSQDRGYEPLVERPGTGVLRALSNLAVWLDVPAWTRDFRLVDRTVVNALLASSQRSRLSTLYLALAFDATAAPRVPSPQKPGPGDPSPLQAALTSLAIIANHLGRIVAAAKGEPQFVIRRQIGRGLQVTHPCEQR